MIASVALTGFYDDRLVALSVLIAVLAAYAALDLAERVTDAQSGARTIWICCGAIAMGIGIWAMHCIGMEAFQLPVLVMYDWPTVLLSLFAAVLASGVALVIVSRPTMGPLRMIVGGIFMGSGMAAVHYIGMAAMRLPAMCVYSPGLVLLSVLLAIVISVLALHRAFHFRETSNSGWRKCGSALLLGPAICTMHYVGMAAAHFVLRPSITDHDAISITSLGLVSITVVTLLILGLVYVASIVDRRFSQQAQQLTDSQLQMQTIFDKLVEVEGVVVQDDQWNIVRINRSAAQLLGLSEHPTAKESIVHAFDLFFPNGEPVPKDEWPSALARRGEFLHNRELIIRRIDTGKVVTVQVSTSPIAGRPGEAQLIVSTYRDITQTRQIDEARTRLEAIVESSEDAIIGKDDGGMITSWNTGAEKIFGYTAEEMIGQSIARLLPVDRLQEEYDILKRSKQGETIDHIETVRKKKNGQFIHVSLTISPVRDASGKVVGASMIARNITDRKQLESQLYQSQKMEAIGQLTGGIAHDFNNLLGVIVGNLDLLERLVSKNEAGLKRVQTAQKAAARGADLTRRLLAFSSNVELKPAPIELHPCVHNTIELARALGPDIKITTHFDDSMPLVLVDPAGLESALLNLAVNARDAMPKGGTLTISTQLSNLEKDYPPDQAGELKAGRYACISISDTGHGMSKETLERVFEPFFTTKPRGKGTGLGLAMVYGFVKQSGGTVRIYSELNYGTTVTFYLPLAKGVSQSLPIATPALSPARLTGKVLVVDDELDLLEIASAYLEEMGYTVYSAEDGASALEVVEQHKDIDLIVTDIIMPGGMNGVELAQNVRQLLPQIKVIYCSGYPADALAERSMPLVDAPLLLKPYQRSEFGVTVRAAMEYNQEVTEDACLSCSTTV